MIRSKRACGFAMSDGWLFWGDDPYIKCDWCGEIRVSKFDYQATRGLALATFVDPKTGDRVFVAKEAAGDQSAPQAG